MRARKKGLLFLLFLFSVPLFTAQTGLSNPIALEETIRMALAKNEQILDSEASLEIAQLNLRRAEKLFATPHINLNLDPWQGRYNVERETSGSSAEFGISGTIKFSQGTDISLNYQGIYDYESQGYNDSYRVELHQSLLQDQSLTSSAIELYSARVAVEKARLNLEDMKKEIVLTTVKSFYQLLETNDSLDLMQKKVALSQKKLIETLKKRDFGLAGQIDVLKERIEVMENTEQLNELENQLVLAKDQFYHSIGAEEDTQLIFSPVEEEKLKKRVEELLAEEISEKTVLAQSELRKAQWAVDDKYIELSKKEESLSPDWSLTIGYAPEELTSRGIVPAQWQAKIGASYSLFDGRRAELSVQTAEMELERAERNLENLKKTTKFNLSSQKNALREALSQFNLLKLKKDEIKLKGELTKEQFARGIISDYQLREFQLQEIQLENSYQLALNSLLTSYFSYRLSLGMSIDIDEVIGK